MSKRVLRIFFGDFETGIMTLSKEARGDLLEAIIAYALRDEEVELSPMVLPLWLVLKDHIDRQRAYSEQQSGHGKRGGRPKKGDKRVKKGIKGYESSESESESYSNKHTVRDGFADFDLFWSAWPKKVGKKDAQKAWVSTEAKRPTVTRLLGIVEIQKASDQWKRGIIPNPATWLNGERWEDVMESPIPAVKSTPGFMGNRFDT